MSHLVPMRRKASKRSLFYTSSKGLIQSSRWSLTLSLQLRRKRPPLCKLSSLILAKSLTISLLSFSKFRMLRPRALSKIRTSLTFGPGSLSSSPGSFHLQKEASKRARVNANRRNRACNEIGLIRQK